MFKHEIRDRRFALCLSATSYREAQTAAPREVSKEDGRKRERRRAALPYFLAGAAGAGAAGALGGAPPAAAAGAAGAPAAPC
jgi:hypothetical protein